MSDRNEEICRRYTEGATQAELAKEYSITSVRVGQILHQAGLSKTDRPKESPYKRSSFIGALVTKSVKDAVQRVAISEGKSTSGFISDLIVSELKQRNVEIREPMDHPRLP